MSESSLYIGRFAPSPSGPLHLGSLVAALGSFLQARSQNGKWLVRIEDIDPPRELVGASALILQQLQEHGLTWDGQVLYQSQQSARYEAILARLADAGQSYSCQCTRAQIKAAGGHIRCAGPREKSGPAAIRFLNQKPVHGFTDRHLGNIEVGPELAEEDFVIRRKDGLYAYQLAVVADDIEQGITEVVRGADLLEATVLQIALYHALGAVAPSWLHLPLAVSKPGFKLSKQNHAPALQARQALANIRQALAILGFGKELLADFDQVDSLLNWAVANWHISRLPGHREVQLELSSH